MGSRILVISDIHLGLNDRMCIFSAGAALARFLDWAAGLQGDVTLVILGDALDYLQIRPWDRADPKTALQKTEDILAANTEVFAAFGRAVAKHQLVWCIGNHDLELLFADVRARIEQALGTAPRWVLDGAPLVYETDLGAKIRLVHGNDADAFNRVDYAALTAIAATGGDLAPKYPLGSRLVAQVFNPLKDEGYRYVDLLKPEEEVALPLTLALWPDRCWSRLVTAFPKLAKGKLVAAVDAVKAAVLGPRKSFASGDQAAQDQQRLDDDELVLEVLLRPVIDQGVKPEHFVDWGEGQPEEYDPQQKPAKTFAWGGGVAEALFRGAARRNAKIDPFDVFAADDLSRRSEYVASEKVALVVAGHTHLARVCEREGSYYINTGTWADLMRLPANMSAELLQQDLKNMREFLREDAAKTGAPPWLRPFRRLTFADIAIDGKQWGAALRQWPEEHPPALARVP